MLLALRIADFAVIDEVELAFGPGLTVLTGETGAGKSLLVGALGLLLGGRSDAEAIRAGATEAVVEATFARTPALAERLSALGLPDLGAEVSIRRSVAKSGRGRAHVNGALVSVGVLGQLMRGVVEIAGQNEHVSLFDPATHRALLDSAAQLGPRVEAYGQAFAAWRALLARGEALGGDARTAADRIAFLRYQLDELERFAPTAQEEALLEEERRRLSSVDRVKAAAEQAQSHLAGQDGAALELLGKAVSLVQDAARMDPSLAPLADALSAASSSLEDCARKLSRHAEAQEADPARLQEVIERLDALRALCRKHGTDAAGLLTKAQTLGGELAALEGRGAMRAALEEELAVAASQARTQARALSAARAQAAAAFAQGVQEHLSSVALAGALFEVSLGRSEALGPFGQDVVELLFSANAGEPPRALAKVASGGEASRLLLALRRATGRFEACSALVLDEVDAGVSGAVAEVVGRMIKDVAEQHQVLCITHLPQVAAFADTHFSLAKRAKEGRTVSRVHALVEPDARRLELARMLSGVEVTPEAVVAADALVRTACAPPPRPRGKVRRALGAPRARAFSKARAKSSPCSG